MLEKLVREELEHGEEETQCRADRRDSAADRSRSSQPQAHRAGLPGSGHHRTNLLSLAQGIRRSEAGTGASDEATGEGERSLASAGDGSVAGEASAEGGGGGKLLSPERRRCAVQHAREQHRLSERRACRLLGQWRGKQGYSGTQGDEEDGLTRGRSSSWRASMAVTVIAGSRRYCSEQAGMWDGTG